MDTKQETRLIFYVNGKKVVEDSPDPETTLLQYLRSSLRLTGTKLACGEGGCGACTVMISKYDRHNNTIIHYNANACLFPLCAVHGLAVTTIEALGSISTKLHPIQKSLAEAHGTQCGFCTPGIIMSMYSLLRNTPHPSMHQIEDIFQGNLCRCTGYRPILEGFRSFSKDYPCAMGKDCCKNKKVESGPDHKAKPTVASKDFVPYDPSQEPIFPSELQLSDKLDKERLLFRSERVTWYRPNSLQELLELKSKFPQAKLIVGNTEVGVELKFKNAHYPVMVIPSHVIELNGYERTDTGLKFGAATTIAQFEKTLRDVIREMPEYQTRTFAAIVEMLRWFAGYQVRNVAAVVGNIMTASPISDLNPILLSAGCVLTVASKERGERMVTMDKNFFLSYRTTAVAPDEVVVSFHIPFTGKNEYIFSYKQAQRRDDDIATVNAAIRVLFEDKSNIISDVALSFGGMDSVTVMATKTASQLIGRKWDDDLIPATCQLLGEELPLAPGVPGGMESYRQTLTTSFFFKFYLNVMNQLQQQLPGLNSSVIPDSYQSAVPPYTRETSRGVQVYEEVDPSQPKDDAVGRPLVHMSALQQTTGEAVYLDDRPIRKGELYLSLVLSTHTHAKLVKVDPSEALTMPGVVDYIGYPDVCGSNMTGDIIKDEEVFAQDKVVCQGHMIGGILATSQVEARRAANAVKIEYKDLPAIITIEEAIAAESYHGQPPMHIQTGDPTVAMTTSDHVIEGEVRTGGQEHFYLESHSCLAIPSEDGEMEVFSSTQCTSHVQKMIASALGVPDNKIVVRVKRIGGGFGGKETRAASFALPVAVAANKHRRPVRCIMDRDEDMVASGTRHPYLGKYKVGFSSDGHIRALVVDIYSNAGYSLDLSGCVMERTMWLGVNSYRFPNCELTGYLCKTNIPSNTAFRGFGAPQGMFITETIISHVANYLKVAPEKIRKLNFQKEGDLAITGMLLENVTVTKCWDGVMEQSDFENRKTQVEEFNRKNRWKKKGIAVVPVMFGIAFGAKFLNQAGALVHLYLDGSVLVAHSGIEMGQGLYSKMIQVASRVLKIPTSRILISETSNATVPNQSPTAASSGSDLNGMAVMYACEALMKRLEPFISAKPDGKWEDWVNDAYFNRISLSATGFYRTPNIGYDWKTGQGNASSYYTYGSACSEVEIDCLTGNHTVLRTDIVMDVGRSLNPAIDIGQIEGAFVQGCGLFTLESHRYAPNGYLVTRGPGNYKIPSITDIPIEFNVSLLKGASNPKAVYSSKAIGEPPLFLAASVFFAIKHAISFARAEVGLEGYFRLDCPATAERIRMACVDQFTKQFPPPEPGTYTPWTVNL